MTFHEGEIEVQELAGERENAEHNRRALGDAILPGARPFLAQQPWLLAGSRAADEGIWASVLFGEPGFVRSAAGGRALTVDLGRAEPSPHDPLWSNLGAGADLGLLAIELPTRRRLRINGQVTGCDSQRLELAVVESYPNCPQYIQRRQVGRAGPPPVASGAVLQGSMLDAPRLAFLAGADTFFVASGRHGAGLDVSHRGGRPGFVAHRGGQRLRIPDYPGNSMFNTWGNLLLEPQAGLLFVDFDARRTLQLTGEAFLTFADPDPANATLGTGRFWEFEVDRWIEASAGTQLAWEFVDYAKQLPRPPGQEGQ